MVSGFKQVILIPYDGIVKKSGCSICASSLVIAAYVYIRLIPRDLRALPAELFTKPFKAFYDFLQGRCS
jgi:hypothetical protein